MVLDLTASLPPDAVVAQGSAGAVQLGELQPGLFRGRRRTIVAPAGAVLRMPLHVPEDGLLPVRAARAVLAACDLGA